MNTSFMSSSQLHEINPSYRRLMENLGTPLLKSQQHADALQHHLRTSGNTHENSHAPANPTAVIRRSHGPDELLRGVPKRRPVAQGMPRVRDETEDEALSRMSASRAAGGCSMSKSHGAFDGMKRRVQGFGQFMKALVSDDEARARTIGVLNSLYCTNPATLAKSAALVNSTATDHGDFDSFESRYGVAAHAPVAKPITTTKPLTKAIAKPTVASVKQSLGRVQAMVKSLGFDAVQPIVVQPQQYTADQIEAATAACLAAGKCTASQAATISTYIAMGSLPPPDLMACLTGEAA
jgi:hypothetical protein